MTTTGNNNNNYLLLTEGGRSTNNDPSSVVFSVAQATNSNSNSNCFTSLDEDLSELASSTLNISLTKEIHRFDHVDNFLLPKQLHGLQLYKIDEDKPADDHSFQQQQQQQQQYDYRSKFLYHQNPYNSHHLLSSSFSKFHLDDGINNNDGDVDIDDDGCGSNVGGGGGGVPGFPDFPDCWTGQEGWAVWKKTDPKTNSTRIAAHRLRYRRRRTAVNPAGMMKQHYDYYIEKTRIAKRHWKKHHYDPTIKSSNLNRRLERRRRLQERIRLKRSVVDLRQSLEMLSCSDGSGSGGFGSSSSSNSVSLRTGGSAAASAATSAPFKSKLE